MGQTAVQLRGCFFSATFFNFGSQQVEGVKVKIKFLNGING